MPCPSAASMPDFKRNSTGRRFAHSICRGRRFSGMACDDARHELTGICSVGGRLFVCFGPGADTGAILETLRDWSGK